MFNKTSDYALNKNDANSIVCPTADGHYIRLTSADFSSQEEFEFWKKWSDQDYHEQEKAEHIYANHTISEIDMPEKFLAIPSFALEMETESANAIVYDYDLFLKVMECLTEVQARRAWMYYAENMTEKEIGQREGTAQRRISKSLAQVEQKIKKYFLNCKK